MKTGLSDTLFRFTAELLPETREMFPPESTTEAMRVPIQGEAFPDLIAFTEFASGTGQEGVPVRWRARLFVAGEYPDRGIVVTENDLDAVIATFYRERAAGQGVPVIAEHRETPLDPLGTVESLWRLGTELFGLLVFSQAMASHLLVRPDARRLSVGLEKRTTKQEEVKDTASEWRLREVSLVAHPRVADAELLFGAKQNGITFATSQQTPEAKSWANPESLSDCVARQVAVWQNAGHLPYPLREPVARLLQLIHGPRFTDSPLVAFSRETHAAVLEAGLESLLRAIPAPGQSGPQVTVPPVVFPNAETQQTALAEVAARFGLSPERLGDPRLRKV